MSAARTAKPSMAELANGGTSTEAVMVRAAGTRPRAAVSGTDSARGGGAKATSRAAASSRVITRLADVAAASRMRRHPP